MRAVIQRVKKASVSVEGKVIAEINAGLLTLLGIKEGDSDRDVEWMMRKISALRIFEDEHQKMNHSLLDTKGDHLLVSQFTLYGDARKGNRPSFIEAARPDFAKRLYDHALSCSRTLGLNTLGGQFQANMQVSLVNDGPVTLILESPL